MPATQPPEDCAWSWSIAPTDAGGSTTDRRSPSGGASRRRSARGLGRETVQHLAGPEDSFAAAERERGWRVALSTAGIHPPAVVRGDWSADSGYSAGGALAGASAVFCANDQMALGLMRALAESGRRVPEDVAVIGFDDVPDAANYRPPLTTIRQDFAALAHRAVAALVDAIEGAPRSEGSAVIPTELVERDSAG